MQYQNKFRMELFQMAEITVEKVKCGCINVQRGKMLSIFIDLGIKQIF
jgi:hypothetical protein